MKKKSAPLIQNAPCERCHGTHVLIEATPGQRYARGRLCECFPTPCHACSGTGFILRRDRFHREMAASCPECVGRLQRVELYNEARVPRRYLHSRLQATDQDKHNAQIFSLLDAIHRNLPDYLRTHQEQGSTTDDLKGMVLMGPPGTGKTHLLSGFVYQCTITHGISCVFQGFTELLSELRQGYSDGKSDMEIIEPHLLADVLIIDDMGKGRNTPWELGILDTLITERYNRDRIVMVTTNYTEAEENTLRERVLSKDRSEEEQFLSDTIRKRVGERIYSRLREMCYFEELNGPDRRQVD